jgi:hypothetical protein
VVEHGAHHAGGYSATPAAEEDQGLAGGRTEGRACGLQFHEEEDATLDGATHLGYQYTDNEDSSRILGFKVEDDVTIERLGKIFKDMPPNTPCPVPEYSATQLPNQVSSRDISPRVLIGLK